MKKIVHVVGTGTIGEPLIGLFTDFHKHLGVDEVTFHKRTPMTTERGGMRRPSVINVPAAIRHSSPTSQPDRSRAPMPTRVSRPTRRP